VIPLLSINSANSRGTYTVMFVAQDRNISIDPGSASYRHQLAVYQHYKLEVQRFDQRPSCPASMLNSLVVR
jgi:hypothetical protein